MCHKNLAAKKIRPKSIAGDPASAENNFMDFYTVVYLYDPMNYTSIRFVCHFVLRGAMRSPIMYSKLDVYIKATNMVDQDMP